MGVSVSTVRTYLPFNSTNFQVPTISPFTDPASSSSQAENTNTPAKNMEDIFISLDFINFSLIHV